MFEFLRDRLRRRRRRETLRRGPACASTGCDRPGVERLWMTVAGERRAIPVCGIHGEAAQLGVSRITDAEAAAALDRVDEGPRLADGARVSDAEPPA